MGVLGSQHADDFSSTDETRLDWKLIVTIVAIVLLGIINVYSATANGTVTAGGFSMALKQTVFFGIGVFVVLVVMLFDYRLYERLAYVFYGINLFILALVPFIGQIRYGARRWIDLGFFSYQPSETMKFATLLAIAKFFHDKVNFDKLDFKDLLIPGAIIGAPAALTMIQPDLGTGGHLAISGAAILLFVGIRTRILLTAVIVGVVSFPLAWEYGLKPYQRDRIRTFIDPMQDPKGDGYNVIQSMIAVGSGKVTGKGFRQGTQTQLDFTPEGHTDFIFTVLAEEWGLIGCAALVLLYIILFYRCVTIASRARDKFGALLCVGIIGMLFSQILINLAMVTGMFPIVGIPLPLTSYGGTSIITVLVALGLVLNVGYRRTIF